MCLKVGQDRDAMVTEVVSGAYTATTTIHSQINTAIQEKTCFLFILVSMESLLYIREYKDSWNATCRYRMTPKTGSRERLTNGRGKVGGGVYPSL